MFPRQAEPDTASARPSPGRPRAPAWLPWGRALPPIVLAAALSAAPAAAEATPPLGREAPSPPNAPKAAPSPTPAAASSPTRVPGGAGAPPPPVFETTVTALRLPRPLPDVPATVTVITRQELDTAPALTVDEALRAAPSAATFRRTPSLVADPSAQGPNLRGLAPSGVSRALVLLDGVPINTPFGGWVYWRALPRLGLERIEVVPGGGSALFGNLALGGVIQLVSRPVENRAEAEAAVGALGTRTAAAALAARAGDFGVAVEPEFLASDGYVPVVEAQRGPVDRPAKSRHGAVTARALWEPSEATRVQLQARLFDERQNGGTTYTTARARTGALALSLDRTLGSAGRVSLLAFADRDRFEQERARFAAGRAAEFRSAAQQVRGGARGGSAVFTAAPLAAAGSHVLLGGVDLRWLDGSSEEELFPSQPGAASVVARNSRGEQRFVGLFAQEIYEPTPFLQLSAAARVDLWRNHDARASATRSSGDRTTESFPTRGGTEWSPRFGLLVRPHESVRLRASAAAAFRAPTLNELYRPFQVGTLLTAANPALGPERLVGAEAGAEWLVGGRGGARFTGFVSRLRDPIVNVTLPAPTADGATRQRQNVGAARVRGLEASLDLRLLSFATVSLAYSLVDSRITEAPPTQPEVSGKRLPQVARHRAHGALLLRHARGFAAALHVRAQGRQFEDDLNTSRMGGYTVVDLFAAAPLLGGVELFALAENLLEKRYLVGRAGVDTIGPPRLLLAGLRFRAGPSAR